MNIDKAKLIEAIEKRIEELKKHYKESPKESFKWAIFELNEIKTIANNLVTTQSFPTTEPKLPTVEEIELVLKAAHELDLTIGFVEFIVKDQANQILTLLKSKQPEKDDRHSRTITIR